MSGRDGRRNLSKSDWKRIEASLHRTVEDPTRQNHEGLAAMKLTLDRVQFHNGTGPYAQCPSPAPGQPDSPLWRCVLSVGHDEKHKDATGRIWSSP